jgi:hypothetical protein
MLVKQHTGFRCMLLGILFLFFNCVCTAAPVIKITSEDYKQATSLQLNQTAGATETEENQLTTSSYVSRVTHFSFRKQHLSHAYNAGGNNQLAPADISLQSSYLSTKYFLPTPGYYAFLFRYNLF